MVAVAVNGRRPRTDEGIGSRKGNGRFGIEVVGVSPAKGIGDEGGVETDGGGGR